MLLPAAAAWARPGWWSRRPTRGRSVRDRAASCWGVGAAALAAVAGAASVIAGAGRSLRTGSGRWLARRRAIAPSVLVVLAARRPRRPGRRASGSSAPRDSPLVEAAAAHRTVRRRGRRRRGTAADARAGVGRGMRRSAPARRRVGSSRSTAGRPRRWPGDDDARDPSASPVQLGTRLAFDARVTPLPAAEASAFRLRPSGDVPVVTAAAAGSAGRPASRAGSRRPRAGLGGDGGALVPGLAIGDTSAVGEELDAAMKASLAQPPHGRLRRELRDRRAPLRSRSRPLCGLRRTVRVVVAARGARGLRRARHARSRASCARARWRSSCSSPSRPGDRVAASPRSRWRSWHSSPSTPGSPATTGSRSPLRPPRACSCSRRRSPARLVADHAGAARGGARRAARGTARLPARARAARSRDRPVRCAREPPRGAGGAGRHGRRAARVPAPAGAAVRRRRVPAGRLAACVLDRARRARRGRPPRRTPSVGVGLARARCCSSHAPRSRCGSPSRPATGTDGGEPPRPAPSSSPSPCRSGSRSAHRSSGTSHAPGSWDVAACDIGQGDAVLVRSAGATALIDTGPEPAALERCLALLGIGRIDLLVAHALGRRPRRGSRCRRRSGRHRDPRTARRLALRARSRPVEPIRRRGGRGGGRSSRRTRRRAMARALAEAGRRSRQRRECRARRRRSGVSRACSSATSVRRRRRGC